MLENFGNVKVLVVGDIMLDRYWWGSVTRISPEAPVPIVDLHHSTFAPGGAANVAANIAGLGAEAFLLGSVGVDHEGDTLVELLRSSGVSPQHLVQDSTRQTSVKTRIIAHSQQVVRVDNETSSEHSPDHQTQLWERLTVLLSDMDAVILSDYAKGLLSPDLVRRIIEKGKELGKLVLVDPKGKDYSRYKGATLITPNRREAAEACNLSEDLPDLINIAGNRLLDELQLAMVLITQSEEGMTLFRIGEEPVHLSTTAKEIYDVTGAGDTVIACIGVALGAGMDFIDAASLANLSAGLVVEQVGTTAITREMLKPALAGT